MACKNGLGDLFISDLKRKERESDLLDAELQRKQQEQLIDYMGKRKVMYSGDSTTDKNKYLILGGLAVVMLAVLILKA